MTNQIEAILFDFGGTLRRTTPRVDSEKYEIVKKILDLIGHPADPGDFTRLLSDRSKAYQDWAESQSTELNEVDLWTRWMLPDFPAEQIGLLAVKLNHIWRDSIGIRIMIPEAQATLLDLFRRGYRLGLVSNTTSSLEVPYHLDELGLAGCFDTVILSCQVGMRKPDPGILLEATRRMDIQPGHCAYIGNHPERDVVAARGAGFGATVILRDPINPRQFNQTPELTPDHFIDNLQELLELFPSRKKSGRPVSNGHLCDASLSTMWGIKKFSAFEDFFLAASRLGFSGIELNHQVSPDMLAEVDLACCQFRSIHEPCPAVISAVELKKQDLLISSPVEARRLDGVNSIKRSIDLASQLGSQAVVVHCGQVQSDWEMERRMFHLFDNGLAGTKEYLNLRNRYMDQRAALVDPYLQAVRKSLLELLDYAKPLGIRLGIENRYHYSDIPTLDEMEVILGMAGSDQLGFIYDVGHAQTQDRLGFYPHEGWLQRYADRMIGTHLHDVIGIHDHRAPGLGEIDFRWVAGFIPKDAFRTIEIMNFNTPEQIKTGMQILVNTGCVSLVE